ncbi:amidase [Blastococcus sp. SYSU DS0539]
METTVSEVQTAFRSGKLTCAQLVQGYLDRIEAYDDQFASIVTVNPDALETAAEKDAQYKKDKKSVGSLHCVPILLKDNFNTADMPTTSGSEAMEGMTPAEDATTVAAMRDEGALILGKTHLHEFARGGESLSSLGGQVHNPYDLTRTPGGSSGGTGAAIAANFGLIGTGSDTGQSIRSPSSANSLVGIRPTRGLVSRHGVAPNSYTQDEIGPIARTVEDAARLLDVMVGYDSEDPITANGEEMPPNSYLDSLTKKALKGTRIGLMTNLMGDDPAVHGEVNAVVADAVKQMEALGAEVVPFEMEGFEELSAQVSTSNWEAAEAMADYLEDFGPDTPYTSLADIVATGKTAPSVQQTLEEELELLAGGGTSTPEYLQRYANRDQMRNLVLGTMADLDLDAIVYPHQKRLVVPIGESQVERNGLMSNSTGLPAVTFQGGFSAPSQTAPVGVPIGIELLGRAYSEDDLLSYAYAFEQAADVRVPPASAPALESGHPGRR